MKKKSIVFITGSNQTNLLKKLVLSKENILGIILPLKSKHEERLKNLISFAKKKKIKVFRVEKGKMANTLLKLMPDILLSFGYPYLLLENELKIAKFNINIHPSLLPKYRGPNIEWYIIARGEKVSGVTVHLLDKGMDSGPIISQIGFPLSKFETINSMAQKISNNVFAALKEAFIKINSGNFKPKIQNEKLQTTYKKTRNPADSEIDASKTLLQLYDSIRACDPKKFPAFFYIDGQKVGIKIFRLNKPSKEKKYI